jgi:transposase
VLNYTAKTYLVNINTVNQWIARYKKDGIKGLNEKPHTGRIGLFAKTLFKSVSAGRASTTLCLKFFI